MRISQKIHRRPPTVTRGDLAGGNRAWVSGSPPLGRRDDLCFRFSASLFHDRPHSDHGILFLGLVFKFAGFAVRDELWLQGPGDDGPGCDAIFYAVRAEPVPQSVAANLLLVSVNLGLVLLILTERTTWRMSPDDRTLYQSFPTLTPGQFRRLKRIMRRETVAPGTPLTLEGKPVDDLMLVYSERIEIEKAGASFPIAGPAFVGEIALLTGNVSSASVRLPEGGTVVRMPLDELKARMARAPSLSNAMVALFGQELARKVADSVPMDRAAMARPRQRDRGSCASPRRGARRLSGRGDRTGPGRRRAVLKRLTLILGLSITALAVGSTLAAAGPPVPVARPATSSSTPTSGPARAPSTPTRRCTSSISTRPRSTPMANGPGRAVTWRRADRPAVRPWRGGGGLRRLFAEPDRTSPERIAESWSRFRDGIPPVLPDLGLPPHDQVFAAAIAGRPVVLSVAGGQEGEVPVPLAGVAVTGALPPGLTQLPAAVVNLPDLTAAAAGLGTISLGRSGDGVTRTVPLVSVVGETLMPALSVELLRVAQGAGGHVLRTTEGSGEVSGGTVAAVAMRTGALSYPVEADGAFRIHFSGDRPGRVTPAARCWRPRPRPRACRSASRGASCWWAPPRRGSSTSAPRRSTRRSRA
jgi:CRP-like cAMP-binding protein